MPHRPRASSSPARPLLLALPVIVALGGIGPATTRADDDPGRAGWVRVYGVKAEPRTMLDGRTFMDGYLVGTSVAPTSDGSTLVAGYVRPYADHPVDLAVLRVEPTGAVRWMREYAPRSGRGPAVLEVARDRCGWADVAATEDGGAVVVFGATVLRLDGEGRPIRADAIEPSAPAGGGLPASVRLCVVRSLGEGAVAVAGLYAAPPAERRPPALLVARLAADASVTWARRYEGIGPGERPGLLVGPGAPWVVGGQPTVLAGIDPVDGRVAWSSALELRPFTRGPRSWPDVGIDFRFGSLGRATGGDLLFGGRYDLSHPSTYRAWGTFVARLSPDAGAVRWTRRFHGPFHGGDGTVLGIAAVGDDLAVVGTSTEFGASHVTLNNNVVAARMAGDGTLRWIRSFGKKKRSDAQSEYANEMGCAIAAMPDGGIVLAGASDGFAHPDPGFHQVVEWAHQPYDLVVARIAPDGGIARLPAGPYPRVLSAPDVGDPKQVDVVEPPIGTRPAGVVGERIALRTVPSREDALTGELQTQFSTDGDGSIGPDVVEPSTCTVTLSEGGRVMTSSCPVFVPEELRGDPVRDPDGDGIDQAFEDRAMVVANPRIVLDEEEEWLRHRATDTVVNFVRVAPWRPEPPGPGPVISLVDPQRRYVIFNYGITWSRDYGRFANDSPELVARCTLPWWVPGSIKAAVADAIRDRLRGWTREHPGDVEHAVLAWKVEAPDRLRLTHVYTTAHGGEDTGHSGVWAAEGETEVTGKKMHVGVVVKPHAPTIEDPRVWVHDVGYLPGGEDRMRAALEFAPDGVLRLYASEDKHAMYPTAACGGGVTLVEIDFFADIGEDCGGGGEFRFECVNVGEPDHPLVDDLDAPATWRRVSAAARRVLVGAFPQEQVWGGNKHVLRLHGTSPEQHGQEPKRVFCGGRDFEHWRDSPSSVGGQLGSFPGELISAIAR